jgi:hypothetical protein
VTVTLNGTCEHCGEVSTGPQSLDEIAKVVPEITDRLRAMDQLAKVGIGANKELTVEHVRDRLVTTLAILCEELPVDTYEHIKARLKPVWA